MRFKIVVELTVSSSDVEQIADIVKRAIENAGLLSDKDEILDSFSITPILTIKQLNELLEKWKPKR